MVSKPTGRPRGRPKKEPAASAPKRARGRPDVALADDPDRYLVALLEAHRLVYAEAVKDRPAASILAGFQVGNELVSAETGGGMGVVVWGPQDTDRADGLLKNTKAESGTALSIEGRAKTLREKAAKWRKAPERQIWLHCMATAFAYALGCVDS